MLSLSTRQSINRSSRFLLCSLFLALSMAVAVAAAEGDNNDNNEDVDYSEIKKEKRAGFMENIQKMRNSKLWFLRDIHPSLPMSPVTLLFLTVVTLNIYMNYGTYAWCEASHILIKGHNPDDKKTMTDWAKAINSNFKLFEEYARKNSECPSGDKGGSLGRFYRGSMAKNFDKACFDPSVATNTCIGPLETSFGFHLIFIKARNL